MEDYDVIPATTNNNNIYNNISLDLPIQPLEQPQQHQQTENAVVDLGFEHFEQYNQYYFYNRDYENKLCIDCQCTFPTYVSINHGIIICESCAMRHKALGYNISYVRKLNDEWDDYLVSFMLQGGNHRFKRFCLKYELNSLQIEQKYLTRITEYYRLLLKSEVQSSEPPFEIAKDNALDPISNSEDMVVHHFPEFKNYVLFPGNVVLPKSMTQKVKDCFTKDALKSGIGGVYNTGKTMVKSTMPVVKFVGKAAFKGLGMAFNYISGRGEERTGSISDNQFYEGGNYFAHGNNNNNNGGVGEQKYNNCYGGNNVNKDRPYMQGDNRVVNNGMVLNDNSEKVDWIKQYEQIDNEYYNTDKQKARTAANNFLLKHK